MLPTPSTNPFEPNLQNHFGVYFGVRFDRPLSDSNWVNPYARAIIKPYTPSKDQDKRI